MLVVPFVCACVGGCGCVRACVQSANTGSTCGDFGRQVSSASAKQFFSHSRLMDSLA